jgi:hypothetical protein
MADTVAKDRPYVNVRIPDELMVAIEEAIRSTKMRDPAGHRSDYLREAATTRVEAERGMFSGRMAAILERYDALCELELPELPVDYWDAILDASQDGIGFIQGKERLRPALLRARLVEVTRDEQAPVVRRVAAMSYAEILALLNWCEMYWAARLRGLDPAPPKYPPSALQPSAVKKRGKS